MNNRQVYINIICGRLEVPYFLMLERLNLSAGATRPRKIDIYKIILGRDHRVKSVTSPILMADNERNRVTKLPLQELIMEYNSIPGITPENRGASLVTTIDRKFMIRKVLEEFAYKYIKERLDLDFPDGDNDYCIGKVRAGIAASRTELRKRAYILYKVCKKFRAPELCEPLLASEGLSPVSYKPYMYGTLLDSVYKGLIDEEIQGRSDIVVGCDHVAIMEEIYAKIASTHG